MLPRWVAVQHEVHMASQWHGLCAVLRWLCASAQIVALTMVALALSEDSITQRDHRETIIESLAELPNSIREVLSKLNSLTWLCLI